MPVELYKNPDGTIGADANGFPMLAPTQAEFEACCCVSAACATVWKLNSNLEWIADFDTTVGMNSVTHDGSGNAYVVGGHRQLDGDDILIWKFDTDLDHSDSWVDTADCDYDGEPFNCLGSRIIYKNSKLYLSSTIHSVDGVIQTNAARMTTAFGGVDKFFIYSQEPYRLSSNLYDIDADPDGNMYFGGYGFYAFTDFAVTDEDGVFLDPATLINYDINKYCHAIGFDAALNYYVGNGDGYIRKFENDYSGTMLWEVQFFAGDTGQGAYRLVVDSNDYIYAVGYRDTYSVVKIDSSDGSVVWTFDTGGNAFDIALDETNSRVYVVGEAVACKNIWKLNASTGALVDSALTGVVESQTYGAVARGVATDGTNVWVVGDRACPTECIVP